MIAIAHAALAITAVLFDSLWEGALIAGAVWLGLRCLPKLDAATRYAIWLCALAALVLIPALTVSLPVQTSEGPMIDARSSEKSSVFIAPPTRPQRNTTRTTPEPTGVVSESAPAAFHKSQITIPQTLAVVVALIWMAAACARGLQFLLDVRALVAIRRDAWLYSAAHDYPIFLSRCVQVPLATGFLRAAIILPASLVERLCSDAVDAIIIHEVAHLRRYDVWTNALARMAEALVALNPAAWFVLRRLSMEREIACDDWVVARTGAGDAFARTLATMASSAGSRVPLAAPSAFSSRHAIVVRIERLLDSRPRCLRLSPSALGGALMLFALIGLTMQSVSPVLAYEGQPDILALDSTAAPIASNCAVPNRGIRLAYLEGPERYRPRGAPPMNTQLPNAGKMVARFGASNVAIFDLTVDAAGKPRKVTVISAPRYPGMAEHVTRVLMTSTYEPAILNCAPVAATTRAGAPFRVERNTGSVIVPVYAGGWSADHQSACKVPTVTHARFRSGFVSPTAYTEMLPAFPDSMKNIPVDAAFTTSVRVHANAAGAATSAVIFHSSGQQAFDNAALGAARHATYPLTVSNCKPLPTQYVWNTTFGTQTLP